ncbi:TrkH family potassium uptake protein [Salarchaeum japonicum]|uniref:TrkH family potassium uptake protein n=1 Tax=Salarchaeum japonicum TaxID=555573 RepID=A0AAV3SZ31_9EURY|nr:TrkH family potassium uptake protein [Salarchaeum japonicum]
MRLWVAWRASLSLVGTVVKWLSVPLLFPLALAAYYGDGVAVFAATIGVAFAAGWLLERLDDDPDLGSREAFLMVGVTWLAVSVVGALPYLLEAHGIPGVVAGSPDSTLADPVNALFESMSGFTTTGATVMGHISFDHHSRALMMWRQVTQWLGGMGIVVLALAILPQLSVGGAQLMEAEAPGPGLEKLTPRIAQTARRLWGLYLGLTALEVVVLALAHEVELAPNMGLYNAVAHGFTTMPTGGFSPAARSIEAFSAVAQWIIIPFMVAAGTNFALFWHATVGDRRFLDDTEFRWYVGVLGVLTAVLAGLLFTGQLTDAENVGRVAGAVEPALRHAAFQVAAIVTTTGYASMDFTLWGEPAKYLLFAMLFVGGSAGSTGGGIKIIRWIVVAKSVKRELFTTVHPDAVKPVRLGGRALDEKSVRGIHAFTLLYLGIVLVGTFLVALFGTHGGEPLTVFESLAATASTVGNVGPAFGFAGPMGNYLSFSAPAKLLMVAFMWIGRLEIFPVLVLLTRSYWAS